MHSNRFFRLMPSVLSAALVQMAGAAFAQDAAPTPTPAPAAVEKPVAPPTPETVPPGEIAPPAAVPGGVINDTEIPGGDAPVPKGRNRGQEQPKRARAPRKPEAQNFNFTPAEKGEDVFIAQADGFAGDVDKIRVQAERQLGDLHTQLNGMRGLFSTGTSRRTLVLPTGATEPQALSQTHEDLVVMHRLLTKALSSKSNSKDFAFRFNSDDRQVDAMYLEGYGSVFLLNVDYPLVEPAKQEKRAPEAEPKDPTWDQERRTALGQEPEEGVFFGGAGAVDDHNSQPEFNVERVNRLQNRMIETLKHAANLRALKPDEDVIVVIAGRSQPKAVTFTRTKPVVLQSADGATPLPSGAIVSVNAGGPSPGKVTVSRTISGDTGMALIASDRGSQSSMVLRVKKSAVDALANGKLDADGFRSSVKITAQAGEASMTPGGGRRQ